MKNTIDINNDKFQTQNDRQIFMFFSKKSATQFGHSVAYVRDDKSGKRKKVQYTATSSDEIASEYKWPDKQLIWSGRASEFEFIGTERPSLGKPV